jgi:hypothetical protein
LREIDKGEPVKAPAPKIEEKPVQIRADRKETVIVKQEKLPA